MTGLLGASLISSSKYYTGLFVEFHCDLVPRIYILLLFMLYINIFAGVVL